MKDETKTKQELIRELEEMRQQVAELKERELLRNQKDAAIMESEAKYRSLASTADSMYLVDRNCIYRFMNERYLQSLEIPRDDVIGRTYGEFHTEKDSRDFARIVKNVFETGEPIQFEYKRERDGRNFIRTFSPVKDRDGKKTIEVTVVSKDITDRKRAEEQLKESEQRLHDIINFLPDATYAIDREGKVIVWNRAIEEMTGIKASDILGKGDYEYAVPFYGTRRPILVDLVFLPDKGSKKNIYL